MRSQLASQACTEHNAGSGNVFGSMSPGNVSGNATFGNVTVEDSPDRPAPDKVTEKVAEKVIEKVTGSVTYGHGASRLSAFAERASCAGEPEHAVDSWGLDWGSSSEGDDTYVNDSDACAYDLGQDRALHIMLPPMDAVSDLSKPRAVGEETQRETAARPAGPASRALQLRQQRW